MKATLLEALGRAYESAHETDKAFQAWNQLYSLSQAPGFASAGAEAAIELGKIYKSRNTCPRHCITTPPLVRYHENIN